MAQTIFLNLPVSDVQRSRAFYGALGFDFDERFCNDTAACVAISDTIFLMLLQTDRFASFSPGPVSDPAVACDHLICLSRDSRQGVDAITEAAIAAGGVDNDKVQEAGDFMYGRSFSDPDGHVFEPMWMDMERALAAWSRAAS